MKKMLLVLVLLITICMLKAQMAPASRIAINGGLSLSNFSGSDSGNNDNLLGLTLGGYLTNPIQPNIAIKSGLQFVQRGISESGNFNGYDVTEKIVLSYLEVPLLIELKLNPQLYIFGGSYVGFLLNAKYNIEVDDESDSDDISDLYDNYDFGLVLGGLLKFNSQFGAEIRMEKGFSKIVDTPSGYDEPDFTNLSFSFLLTMFLN